MKKILKYLIMTIKTIIGKLLSIQSLVKEVENDLKEFEKEQTTNPVDGQTTYIGPEVKDVHITFSGYDTLIGTQPNSSVVEGTSIVLPSASKKSTAQYNYTFVGWRKANDTKLYQGGEKVNICEDSTFTAEFTPVKRSYTVKLQLNNGYSSNTITRTVLYGAKVSWVITPYDGYELPTKVINGIISGKTVYSERVTHNMAVIVTCTPKVSYISYVTPQEEPDYSNLPMWQRPHKADPDVQAPEYIEVDMADPWKDYGNNAIRCLNGTFKEEFSVLNNDLVEFAGPYGDNIWLGKKEGTGYVILVGPNYTFNEKPDVYTVIKVKVYNSENNTYIG